MWRKTHVSYFLELPPYLSLGVTPPPTNCPMPIDTPGDNDLDSVLDGLAKVIADGAGALWWLVEHVARTYDEFCKSTVFHPSCNIWAQWWLGMILCTNIFQGWTVHQQRTSITKKILASILRIICFENIPNVLKDPCCYLKEIVSNKHIQGTHGWTKQQTYYIIFCIFVSAVGPWWMTSSTYSHTTALSLGWSE